MRDPTTTTNLVEDYTKIAYQYLCERDLLETCEGINASFARSNKILKAGWPAAMRARPPARKRGRPPQRRDLHIQIAGAIAFLVKYADLNPLRSHLGRQDGYSACSIITAALKRMGVHLNERTVEGIWSRYRRSPRIIHLDSLNYVRNYHLRTRS